MGTIQCYATVEATTVEYILRIIHKQAVLFNNKK